MDEYLRLDVHQEFARRMEDEHRRMSRRLEEVEDITKSISKLANSMEHMATEQKKQGERLEKLEKIPAKRWESMIGTLITALAGGVFGYIINMVF